MKHAKTRVLVADDHALMRVGLKTILNAQPDIEVAAEADDGQQAVRLARQLRPDVVVMDLMMPVLNGAEATRQICSADPGVRILILTSFSASADLQRAIRHGASGVQLKEQPITDIIAAIRAVASGETAIPPEIARLCAESPEPRELTERQMTILRAVTNGLTNKEIAARHNLSQGGVKKHLNLIFAKLGVTSRAEAIAAALRKHLLNN